MGAKFLSRRGSPSHETSLYNLRSRQIFNFKDIFYSNIDKQTRISSEPKFGLQWETWEPGGTYPQDFAINKEVPFLFSGIAP